MKKIMKSSARDEAQGKWHKAKAAYHDAVSKFK
jgi:hypothetical protein